MIPPYKDQRPVYEWGRRSGRVYLREHAEIMRLVYFYTYGRYLK